METSLETKKQAPVIRTPDQHLRVFVSSSLRELASEREAVRQALQKLRLAPVMFESGARPYPAQDLYQAYLAQSHIFIGIYWQSYGWIGPGMQISGLEDEYNRSTGLPRLIYIKNPAPDQEPTLNYMLERIRDENASAYKYFTTPDELEDLVENDLILLMTEYFETAREQEHLPDRLIPTSLTNVPMPRNLLIGRDAELETTCSLLLREDVALVTLSGPAGIGKSRLGIQIALELRDQFSDGVYMVALESIREPELVIPTIAKTLNITEQVGGLSTQEMLKHQLCSKQMLLLLDNFEHVLPAAPQIADLLESCSKVKILVTSRALLHLRVEKQLPIQPLKVPPFKEKLEVPSLSQYSAVQLFIQRCQAVKADFQVTNENAAAVAEICYHLDGLPLAIELAAARIKLLPPQALLSRLEHRFEVLRGGTTDLPERQKTMYSAIDWSYNLLEEYDKRLFKRLSVFFPGWTVEAACSVGSEENGGQLDVLDGLQRLVDNNLIQSVEETSGETRLKMLESIQEFAYEHLVQAEELDQVYGQYVKYYTSFAQQAEIGLQNSSQPMWHRQVDAELCNLRAVMNWAIQEGKSEIALKITLSLWKYWWTHGYWTEGFQWLKTSLTSQGDITDSLRAKALNQCGWFYRNLGDFPSAIAALQESMVLWREIGDPTGLATTLTNMGAAILRQGKIEEAHTYLEDALDLSKRQGDKVGMLLTLEVLGHAAAKQGINERAIEFYTEALHLAEECHDDDHIAKLLNNLGDEYVIVGDFQRAEQCFNRSSVICRQHGNRIVAAYIAGNRSMIAIKEGNYGKAFDLLAESTLVLRDLGDRENTILCLEPFAYIATETGDPERAAILFAASEFLRTSIGMTRASPMQADFVTYCDRLTSLLGEDKYHAAWDIGYTMTLDQAVAYAVQREVV